MIAKIAQTKSNGENKFEIRDANGVLFYAQAPWMNISLPFSVENVRKLTMSDCGGRELYSTSYSVLENTLEQAVPLKFLWAGEQRFGQYSVVGEDGVKGNFYCRQDGFLDKKYCIEKNGRLVYGYSISKGRFEAISFYEDEKQVAQITKPLSVENNLDLYYLHLADDKDDLLPILSFFTIYYDYRNHNHSGEVVGSKTSVSVTYTFDKNNGHYNPNWIEQQFGSLEAERFQQELKQHYDVMKRKVTRIVAIVVASVLVLFLLFFAILTFTI